MPGGWSANSRANDAPSVPRLPMPGDIGVVRQILKQRLSSGLVEALKNVHAEWRIFRLHQAASATAARLSSVRPLRLNLGSGHRPKQGWVNVDLFAPHADLRLDLRRPLPFPDGIVNYIYTEHFFEHLRYPHWAESTGWEIEAPGRPSEALSFVRECLRVLEPGSVLDVVVPDAEMILVEYVNRERDGFPVYPWWGPKWCETPMHCVNYVFRQGREHQYAYDCETLTRVLETAGFIDVRRRPFDPGLDAENHALGSLCMVARKPGNAA
jgi:predicted SAM-dependent methyltransferase